MRDSRSLRSIVRRLRSRARPCASGYTSTTVDLDVGADDNDGESNLTYTWTVTGKPLGADNPTFSANGTNAAQDTTATFSQAGDYEFTVTIADEGDFSTASSVVVTIGQTLTSITATPDSPSLDAGTVQPFSAVAFDQFDDEMLTQPEFTWYATAGTIDTDGWYTAPNTSATPTISAHSGSVYDASAVTITNHAPTVGTAAAASESPVTGISTTCRSWGRRTPESNLTYTWAVTTSPRESRTRRSASTPPTRPRIRWLLSPLRAITSSR